MAAKEYWFSDSKVGEIVAMKRRHLKQPPKTFHRNPRPVYHETHRCEAPKHVNGCNRLGNTMDHFTPQSILKDLRKHYPNKEFYTEMQRLSRACHDAKDKYTQFRAWQVHDQLLGAHLGYGDHMSEWPKPPHIPLGQLTPQRIKEEGLMGQAIHTAGVAEFKSWNYITSLKRKNVMVSHTYSFTSDDGKVSMPLIFDMPFHVAQERPIPNLDEPHWFSVNVTVGTFGDKPALFAHTIAVKEGMDKEPKVIHIGRPVGEQTIFYSYENAA